MALDGPLGKAQDLVNPPGGLQGLPHTNDGSSFSLDDSAFEDFAPSHSQESVGVEVAKFIRTCQVCTGDCPGCKIAEAMKEMAKNPAKVEKLVEALQTDGLIDGRTSTQEVLKMVDTAIVELERDPAILRTLEQHTTSNPQPSYGHNRTLETAPHQKDAGSREAPSREPVHSIPPSEPRFDYATPAAATAEISGTVAQEKAEVTVPNQYDASKTNVETRLEPNSGEIQREVRALEYPSHREPIKEALKVSEVAQGDLGPIRASDLSRVTLEETRQPFETRTEIPSASSKETIQPQSALRQPHSAQELPYSTEASMQRVLDRARGQEADTRGERVPSALAAGRADRERHEGAGSGSEIRSRHSMPDRSTVAEQKSGREEPRVAASRQITEETKLHVQRRHTELSVRDPSAERSRRADRIQDLRSVERSRNEIKLGQKSSQHDARTPGPSAPRENRIDPKLVYRDERLRRRSLDNERRDSRRDDVALRLAGERSLHAGAIRLNPIALRVVEYVRKLDRNVPAELVSTREHRSSVRELAQQLARDLSLRELRELRKILSKGDGLKITNVGRELLAAAIREALKLRGKELRSIQNQGERVISPARLEKFDSTLSRFRVDGRRGVVALAKELRREFSPRELSELRRMMRSGELPLKSSDAAIKAALRLAHFLSREQTATNTVRTIQILHKELTRLLRQLNELNPALDGKGRLRDPRTALLAAHIALLEAELARYASYEIDAALESERTGYISRRAQRLLRSFRHRRARERKAKRGEPSGGPEISEGIENADGRERSRRPKQKAAPALRASVNAKTGRAVQAESRAPVRSLDVVMSKEDDGGGNEYTKAIKEELEAASRALLGSASP